MLQLGPNKEGGIEFVYLVTGKRNYKDHHRQTLFAWNELFTVGKEPDQPHTEARGLISIFPKNLA